VCGKELYFDTIYENSRWDCLWSSFEHWLQDAFTETAALPLGIDRCKAISVSLDLPQIVQLTL
jgi:hypothetical protein